MSFQTLYNRFLDMAQRTRSAASTPLNYTTLAKALTNESHQTILDLKPWTFLEKTSNLTSAASTNNYELPVDTKNNQITAVNYQESSSSIHRPRIIYSPDFWEYLQSLNTGTSDAPQYAYIYDEKLYLWPTPATASLTIQVRYRKKGYDMTQDDYTTGGILTATNGDETIVGDTTPTVWTAGMAGDWLRITKGAAASLGDGYWYEISSITSTTELELVKKYEGTSIAAGSADYTIGEMPLLPFPFHDLILWRSLMVYFMQEGNDMVRAERFGRMYDGGKEMGLRETTGGKLKQMMETHSGTSEGFSIDNVDDRELKPSDLTIPDSNFEGADSW